MRVLFFGTPEFAVPTLEALFAAHDVVGVVTRPDRPKGRGHKVTASPVSVSAQAHGAPVLQPTRLGDLPWLQEVTALRPDIAVVAAYGRLLPQVLLDLPRLGFINVHASLLPRWRGAAPIHRSVLAGDEVAGVTIMRVVLALDAGPMLASVSTPIATSDTSATLDSRLAVMGAGLLVGTLEKMAAGTAVEVAQDESLVTYAQKLERSESRIDWGRPAADVDRQIRGLQPWPLAAGLIEGRRVAFLRAMPVDSTSSSAPGVIVEAGAAGLVVACAQSSALRITEVLPEGRRAMTAAAFLNGTPVFPGAVVGPVAVSGARS